MKEHSLQIISFVSGKGGSGKTAICLSTAYLLARMGYKTLVVDLDFGTHGASYFFKESLVKRLGLIEVLDRGWGTRIPEEELPVRDRIARIPEKELPMSVTDNLWFMPSKADLDTMHPSIDPFTSRTKHGRFRHIFELLVSYAGSQLDVQFILLDCQAGVTPTVEFAVQRSEKTLVVLEPDNISSDAADALRAQLRKKLPRFERYLLNKVDVEEAETYKRLSRTLQGLNHLPPLPFDRYVRDSFGRREVPVSLEEPSTFLFALVRTMRAMLPEIQEELESFEEKKINILLSKYEAQLREATERRESLGNKIEQLSAKIENRKAIGTRGLIISGALAFAVGITLSILAISGLEIDTLTIAAIVLAIGGMGITTYGLQSAGSKRQITELNATREKLERELQDAQDEIRRFESYIYSRSKEFLLDLGAWRNEHSIRKDK